MKTYNNRIHSIIQMSPEEAELKKNLVQVRKNQEKNKYAKIKRKKPKYKKGDKVRISISKDIFGRGYHPYFKEETFIITDVRHKLPIPTYELSSLEDKEETPLIGNFYGHEITLIK